MEPAYSPRSRDARRRRIVERGSDRLALITGRIKTLPSDSESFGDGSDSDNQRGHLHTASCPPSMLPSDFQDTFQREDNAFGPLSTNNRSKPENDENSVSETLVDQPYMHKSEISTDDSKDTILDSDSDSKGQESQISNHSEPLLFLKIRTITYTQVNTAFKATETIRLLCSIAIAVSVILSYIGFPIMGSHFLGSFILFRPFWLLLLTNITLVLARILEEKQESELQNPEHHENDEGLVDHIGSALEIGFMLQDVIGALIMDSSIYIIIVICGLSIARTLGF